MSIRENVLAGLKLTGTKASRSREGRPGRVLPAQGRALERGQGPARRARRRPVRRPAAAAVHRPLAGDQAPGAADGRALLGARPDLDPGDRGDDARARPRGHDRDRHPQHAAGRPGLRPVRVLPRLARHARRDRRARRRPTRCSTTPRTSAPATTSTAGSAERPAPGASAGRRRRPARWGSCVAPGSLGGTRRASPVQVSRGRRYRRHRSSGSPRPRRTPSRRRTDGQPGLGRRGPQQRPGSRSRPSGRTARRRCVRAATTPAATWAGRRWPGSAGSSRSTARSAAAVLGSDGRSDRAGVRARPSTGRATRPPIRAAARRPGSARSGRCSSCPRRGSAGRPTVTATGSPTRRTSTTPRWPRAATSVGQAATSRPAPAGSAAVRAYNHADAYVRAVYDAASTYATRTASD